MNHPTLPSRPLRVAVIGYSFMGKAHSNAWRNVHAFYPDAPPVAQTVLVGRDAAQVKQAAEQYGWAETATSWEEVVDRDDIDIVDICTPGSTHGPIALAALRAGKHVLVEKPLAPSPEEAVEAIRYAEEHGLILQVSQNYRFYPAPVKAAQMIADGELGELGTVSIDFRQWDNDAEAGTHRHYQFVHPLLYDMAIHHVDLMRMVIGSEPVKVFVQETDPAWSKYVEEASATMLVTFANGVVVSYRGSWVSSDEPTYWAGDWRMECEGGLIRWTSRQGGPYGTDGDKVTVRTRDGKVKDVTLDPMPVWGRSAGVQAFITAIETGVPNQNAARNNLPSVALMEASGRALASGEAEEIVLPKF